MYHYLIESQAPVEHVQSLTDPMPVGILYLYVRECQGLVVALIVVLLLIFGVICLVLAPFTGLTVVGAAAFFVIAYILWRMFLQD